MTEEFQTVKAAGLTYDIKKTLGYSSNKKPYEVAVAPREAPNAIATLAFEMIHKWGMVAGEPDGEDSAGRAKLKLVEPRKLVDRAFLCAEAAFEAAKERGHIIDLPSVLPDELEDDPT